MRFIQASPPRVYSLEILCLRICYHVVYVVLYIIHDIILPDTVYDLSKAFHG